MKEDYNHKPVYHDISTCNKCGKYNDVTPIDFVDHTICEADTKCSECGFEDRWRYGFFESGEHGYDACKKY